MGAMHTLNKINETHNNQNYFNNNFESQWCVYVLSSFSHFSFPHFDIDNKKILISSVYPTETWELTRFYFSSCFKMRGNQVPRGTIRNKNTKRRWIPSQYYTNFSFHSFLFLHFFITEREKESRKKDCFQLCKLLWIDERSSLLFEGT